MATWEKGQGARLRSRPGGDTSKLALLLPARQPPQPPAFSAISQASSDCPVNALEKLVADPHLLEDLCFGPTWPQLCDSLGRLVCLLPPSGGGAQAVVGAASSAATTQQHEQQGHGLARLGGGWSCGAVGSVPEMPKQQKLLLQALHEVRVGSGVVVVQG